MPAAALFLAWARNSRGLLAGKSLRASITSGLTVIICTRRKSSLLYLMAALDSGARMSSLGEP